MQKTYMKKADGVRITIEGAPGAGKTSILYEIGHYLAGRGYNVLCTDDGRDVMPCSIGHEIDKRLIHLIVVEPARLQNPVLARDPAPVFSDAPAAMAWPTPYPVTSTEPEIETCRAPDPEPEPAPDRGGEFGGAGASGSWDDSSSSSDRSSSSDSSSSSSSD